MAKGIGLIGNFRGKVGNMVGYNLKDSNNKQTQGVRVYQPVVKNPKTAGQAEQRAKLAPINATYRALKMIIDRGQEGKAYGNKSRLAWLSDAMKAFNGGWFEKGAAITAPALVPLTKGSLGGVAPIEEGAGTVSVQLSDLEAAPTKIGQLSTGIIAGNPAVKNGDQLTFVGLVNRGTGVPTVYIGSIVVDTTSTDNIPDTLAATDTLVQLKDIDDEGLAGCVIQSREGDGGQHMRSTTSLIRMTEYSADLLAPAAKAAAIASYMSAGANTDWAEESLQD